MEWLVSVRLPDRGRVGGGGGRAEFWRYVTELGPDELPAFVSPAEDELRDDGLRRRRPAPLDPEED